MRRTLVSLELTAAVASAALAQTPATGLAKPPANAHHFVIESTGGKHGDSWRWIPANGNRMGRESMNLRGQVFEVDSEGKAGADGMPWAVAIRGVTPSGDAAETFRISAGSARWKSPIDAGSASYSGPAFYSPQGGPIDVTAWFLEALLARPDKTLNLLPGGKAHDHAMVRHGHLHLTNTDLGRHEQQVLRYSHGHRLAARSVRRRAVQNSGRAGEGAGGAGA